MSKTLAQCPTIAPTTIGGCSIGESALELEASGSTGFYSWYDAPTGGNLVNMGASFTTPTLNTTTNYYVAAADRSIALTLDGTNDYVALNTSYTTVGEINQLTLEAWVNTSESGTGTFNNWAIIDFDRSEYFNFFVRGDNGEIGFSTTDITGTIHDFYSGSSNTVNDGNWHHIAAVYDGTDKMIYINGVEVARSTNAHGGNDLGTGLTRFGFIGDGSEASTFNGSRNNLHYNGSVNEVRIWNLVRSASEIAINKDICLAGTEPGLVNYYNFQEGAGNSINDITGNSTGGTLFNFNLTTAWITGQDFSCPTCESSRTIATAIIETAIDLGPDICLSSGTQILDAGSGYSSYLWNTGETTPTITVGSSGVYSVTVESSPGCFGSDDVEVTLIPAPTGVNECRSGPGTVELSVSGSSGHYEWYDAASGGTLLNTEATFTTPIINTTTNYFVSAVTPAAAIEFDGSNDYIAINNLNYNNANYTELTVETWINTSSGATQMIASFDRSEFWRLEVNGNGGGTGQIGFDLMTSSGQLDFGSTTRIDDGMWHHVAAVFDNGIVNIYIDGVLDATTSTGSTFGSNTTRYGFIGTGSEASSFNGTRGPNNAFDGQMNEFRIWNVARSAAQIAASMNNCLFGSESGLVTYYDFNDGTGTNAQDQSNNGNNGSLFNFPTNPWVDEGPISCASCESPRTMVTANVINTNIVDQQLSCVNNSFTLDAGAGFSSYLWNNGATTQTINVAEQGIYSVTASGGAGGCTIDDQASIIGFTSSENSLDFDGANDYLAIDNFSYTGTGHTAVTVETWIKTSSGGNQVIASYDRNQFWRLEINGVGAGTGRIGFDLMTSSGQLDFGGTTRIDDGRWHHVAGVFDNGTVSIYIDGVLDATTTTGATFGSNATRFGFISRGSEASSFNGNTGPNTEINGEIDEFRIWNTARSITEIRNSMCSHISGAESGLEVYYKFDETSGSAINDYSTSTTSNATMINFGSNPHTTSGAPIGDVSTYLYPISWTGQSLNLASCDGDNVTIDNVTNSPDGAHLYFINDDPNSVTNIVNYTTNNHFFGTFAAGNTTSQHDITYSYPNHSLVMAGDEDELALLTRPENSSTNWDFAPSSVNTSLQEVTLTSQSPTQFILDKYQIQWTGTISTDWNTGINWNIGNVPPTGANIIVPDVINQPVLDQNRVIGNLTLEPLSDVDLNAFELSLQRNLTNDGTIISNGGTLNFNGSSDIQLIFANVDLDLDNITIDNPNGVSLSNGAIDLTNTLTLTNGNFSTNNSLTLLSNASGTARIAEITGGSISGDITMQRYIDAGATNWRFLTSAVSGTTLADFNDDFITSGFTGSDFPLWPTAANPWQSIYFYDETQPGIQDNGYTAATNITNSVAIGEGLWIWSGDTITGTQAFTIDMTGPTNTGNINLPITYTNSGNTDDGWNMVGNPYPSTIDWDDPSITKTNINNAIYIWNPDLEQFASYVAGLGTNGGSKDIASSQAFWVQANATGAAVQLTEACKTTDGGIFLKAPSSASPLTINVQNSIGSDQTIINFNANSTTGFDGMYDASKILSANTNLPSISTIVNDSTELSINQMPQTDISIPLKITTGVSGFHTIDISGIQSFNHLSCIFIEDLFSGITYDLTTTTTFTTFIYDTTSVPRFLIKLGTETITSSTAASCFGNNDGSIVIQKNAATSFNTILKDDQNNVIVNHSNTFGIDSINNLSAGTYLLETTDNTCGSLMDSITIVEPLQITASFSTNIDTVYLTNGGIVQFTNLSNNASSYRWDFDDLNTSTLTSPTHQYLQAGTYNVTLNAIQNANCFEQSTQTITVIDVATSINDFNQANPNKVWINNNHLMVSNNIDRIEVRNVLGQLLITSDGNQKIDLRKINPQTLIISTITSDKIESTKLQYIKN